MLDALLQKQKIREIWHSQIEPSQNHVYLIHYLHHILLGKHYGSQRPRNGNRNTTMY